jgi:hypothetical protein
MKRNELNKFNNPATILERVMIFFLIILGVCERQNCWIIVVFIFSQWHDLLGIFLDGKFCRDLRIERTVEEEVTW